MLHDFTGKTHRFYCKKCKRNTIHKEWIDEEIYTKRKSWFKPTTYVTKVKYSYVCKRYGYRTRRKYYRKKIS
jgi:hypothetical protein